MGRMPVFWPQQSRDRLLRCHDTGAPLIFGIALDACGADALIFTALLGLSGYAAMLALGRTKRAP